MVMRINICLKDNPNILCNKCVNKKKNLNSCSINAWVFYDIEKNFCPCFKEPELTEDEKLEQQVKYLLKKQNYDKNKKIIVDLNNRGDNNEH